MSSDPSQMTESWKLSNGFVIEEAKCLLPHMTKTRLRYQILDFLYNCRIRPVADVTTHEYIQDQFLAAYFQIEFEHNQI